MPVNDIFVLAIMLDDVVVAPIVVMCVIFLVIFLFLVYSCFTVVLDAMVYVISVPPVEVFVDDVFLIIRVLYVVDVYVVVHFMVAVDATAFGLFFVFLVF